MKQKKAQLTAFMIIGLVIFILTGFLFYLQTYTTKKVMDSNIEKIYSDFLSKSAIDQRLKSCLDRSTNDALILAGLQGGNIYIDQVKGSKNATIANQTVPYEINNTIYRVGYGILAPKLGMPKHPDVPDYPYLGPLVDNPRNLRGIFGEHTRFPMHGLSITPLCDRNGPNYFNISGARYSCESVDPFNENSVQHYLQLFIKNKTLECVNLTAGRIAFDYEVVEEEGNVSVLIGDTDVIVTMEYPITIKANDKSITYTMALNTRPKVRLKLIHELATHLIHSIFDMNVPKSDVNNIFFNITRDDPNDCSAPDGTRNQPCKYPRMEVNKIENICLKQACPLTAHFKYSDIIQITDKKSTVDGIPYTLQFAVENRIPALDYIPKIEVYEMQNITIIPKGYDPDEGKLYYNYSGWRADEFLSSDIYTSGSYPYERLKDARIQASGPGDYVVRVHVRDEEGLQDWQDVDIEVVAQT